MPVSKQHQKRKMKLRKRKDSFDSLIKKRVKAFNDLPEDDKVALLSRWQNFKAKGDDRKAIIMDEIEPEEE